MSKTCEFNIGDEVRIKFNSSDGSVGNTFLKYTVARYTCDRVSKNR